MALTLIRLEGKAGGVKVVFDEDTLRASGLYERLARHEQVTLLLGQDEVNQKFCIREPREDEPPEKVRRLGSVLRLRTDGKAEAVFFGGVLEPLPGPGGSQDGQHPDGSELPPNIT